ncbi:MAG: hydroxymethylglutaryl-CoA reductase, degradative [Bacteriovoracaceae bacterium]|jgi:hydroxymethylglutaryl-CoA reductase|nr:hydroxymethylglutaryl-CoA reductase, degradative [Bacteriovoracaceae bacterium]
MLNQVSGFSKLNKEQKIEWIQNMTGRDLSYFEKFDAGIIADQKRLEELSENTIGNFHMPYGLAPNFLINDDIYCVPMVIEESSVVAAASKAAKFWMNFGGFKAKVVSKTKVGHVHFTYEGYAGDLEEFFEIHKQDLLDEVKSFCENMEKRGGGVRSIDLIDKCHALDNYYQLELTFDTCDAMGANFINTVLETIAAKMLLISRNKYSSIDEDKLKINMSILSNYTPNCNVHVSVSANVDQIDEKFGQGFCKDFKRAIDIAKVDISRAVTHNKGIMNGVDAVILATGNDFRSVEACAHSYASRSGRYRSLSSCSVYDGKFTFEMSLPLSVGTVGGLTSLHPMAKESLHIMGNPNSDKLMKICAAVGLAQNFGAVSSLVTTGIQKGHMKMHLLNILNQLEATSMQIEEAKKYFADKIVSFSSVRDFLKVH